MKKTEKAKFVVDKLEELYPTLPVFLTHTNPFTLLVAVLLSAQSTDKGVNKATPALFEVADSAYKMEKLSQEEIKHYIRTIGLNNAKSKNIYKLCRQLLEKHKGEVPESFEELEALAGVGHKTASVVMAQAFGVPSFPVDTHIQRLMHRWTLSNGKNVVQTEKDSKRLFPKDKWNKLHLQIIFFGREHCPARGHKPLECPICSVIGRKDMFKR